MVAEGVETSEVLAQLVALGCDQVQGFYYSPAVDAQQLPQVIERIEAAAGDKVRAALVRKS